MRRAVASAAALTALIVGASAGAPAASVGKPRITNRCPTDALPRRRGDIPAMRRLALAVAPQGVERSGALTIDYRGARARVRIPTFYRGYVRLRCPRAALSRVSARTADVAVSYPRVSWSASLSYSVFMIARTPDGFVAWAQMH